MKLHRPTSRTVLPSQDGRIGVDMGGPPSAYSLAQRSAEVKGLTLHPGDALERLRDLQRQAGESVDRDAHARTRQRATRIRVLVVATVVLWIAVLVALLENL